jgi:site-specific DNA recombinase
MTRVALYTRVSTEEQAMEGTSLDLQLEQLKEHCNRQNWHIVRQYCDPGFSGKNDDRPGLRQLLSEAKSDIFEIAVVSRLDRLARKLRLLLELEEKLKDDDVSLFSLRENIDTSSAIGRTVFQVLGLTAEWEREAMIERTRGGRLQRYKEGRWGPGNVLYGYRYNRETKKLMIDQEQAKVVHRIFDLYSLGKSMSAICNILNDELIRTRTRRAKGWHSGAVRDIIVNPSYKGRQLLGRNSHISKLRKGTPEKIIEVSIPPIVDSSLWEAAQRRLSTNKHVFPTRVNPYLLQGLISCGECSHTFRSEITHRRRYYSCTGRLKRTHVDGSQRCNAPRLDADWLEGEVWSRIETIINDPKKLEQLLSDTIERLRIRVTELETRLRPIDEQLSKLAENKRRLAEGWVAGTLGQEWVEAERLKIEKEENRLRDLRAEVDPDQLKELDRTRSILRFWQKRLVAMSWNLEDEKGEVERSVEEPHKIVSTLVNFEDSEISKIMHFPSTKREMLDHLQVRLIVYVDRVEVKAVFPIEPVDSQLCTPGCRSGRYRRSR